MNLAPYRKAVVAALPSIIGLLLVILQSRLGIALSAEETQLLYVVLGIIGVATPAAVYAVPNSPNKGK